MNCHGTINYGNKNGPQKSSRLQILDSKASLDQVMQPLFEYF